jgi:NAD+ diphosphatase
MPAFAGMGLDRASTLRADPAWVARMLAEPATRFIGAGNEGVLVDGADTPVLVRRPLASSPAADAGEAILLGLEDGAALFAVDLETLDSDALGRFAGAGRSVHLRDAGAILPHAEGGLAAYLMGLLNWHRRHRFCANCGAATVIAEAGYSRRCRACGATHFPRTDPVVIMLVEHAGKVLLGRHAGWPPGRYSALAGFVSPGESLEEAVVREVREESGIEARDPFFVTSQPWPFPSSLMLGFHASSDGGEPRTNDDELEDVRWFALDTIRAAIAGDTSRLVLPTPISIARFLLGRWAATAG